MHALAAPVAVALLKISQERNICVCRPSFWSTDQSPISSLLLPSSSPFSACPPSSSCPPPVSACLRELVRTAPPIPHSSYLHIVAVASSAFCYSMFENCADLASSVSSTSASSASAAVSSAPACAQFALIYVDRDHLSEEFFQAKLKEYRSARNSELQKKQELQRLEESGAAADKKKVVEMEIKAAGETVLSLEKKFIEMQSQRERFKSALKDRGSSTQPFFDLCNSMFATFKSFPLHCFNTQTAIAPCFVLSPPQIPFRFAASTHDDTAMPSSSRLPAISATIEATDVSVLAFNDSAPLLIHSQVSPFFVSTAFFNLC